MISVLSWLGRPGLSNVGRPEHAAQGDDCRNKAAGWREWGRGQYFPFHILSRLPQYQQSTIKANLNPFIFPSELFPN